MDPLEEAIEEAILTEGKNLTAIAKKHGVDRSTLSRRYHGVTGSKADSYDT
ncbi:uncharacterized protein BDZ99DRAFT_539619 [Mytilinidion resinicola]|uniref:HTH psq-type domain-containing protein n=1 Tax=Mytilinidion resinicola TaxID=574789 RepID=A0A6A6YBY3_9PEZI|nr:uncharacterized protein BDZ99DRAFT_539619 [Mytilinidion resinicola]KAF2806119.1 hypothetical protein BDZ99DRAFT_539619 [Mytilinidion resinicola]